MSIDDDIRRIAIENVNNRKKAGIIAIVTGIVSLVLFVNVLIDDFQNPLWIIATAVTFILGMYFAFKYERKIIGKKTAVDYEVERLKNLYPEEKIELPEIEESELKLKEIIRKSNREEY